MEDKKRIILNIVWILIMLILIVVSLLIIVRNAKINDIEDKMRQVKIYDIEDYEQRETVLIEEKSELGKITIPSILLEQAPVKEGTELSTLNEAIGHIATTSLYYGNVGLASHNGGTENANYFENLKNIKVGDEIFYETIYGTKRYIVKTIEKIANDDWSYLEATKDNRLTLITCIRNHPELRLCVQAVEF